MTKAITFASIVIILGICAFAASASTKLTQSQEIQLFYSIFKDWTSQYNKQYGVEELATRFMTWKNNYDFVQEHNAKNADTQLEMNHFADMSSEEFSALHLGLNADMVEVRRKHTESRKKRYEPDTTHEHSEAAHNHTNGTCNHTNGTNGTNGTQNNTNGTCNHTNGTHSHTNETNNNNNSHHNEAHHKKEEHHNNEVHKGLPKSVDWRKAGAVTYVKNQGQCGACWSFSAAGALEGLNAISNKKLESLSVQQMIDCAGDFGNQGCDGGLMTNAFKYTGDFGIQLESAYEYAGAVGDCQINEKKVVFKNNGFEQVATSNFTALKIAVARQPISVGIEASSMTVQLFKGGVITDCTTNLDHGVLVVGYDTDKKGQAYWIVKNSWGPQWGLKGFFNIAMGDQNDGAGVCGINMMASYPTAATQEKKETKETRENYKEDEAN